MTDVAMVDTPAETPPTLLQKIAAEAVGTFVLVFFGCGSVAFLAAATADPDFNENGSFDMFGTAIAFVPDRYGPVTDVFCFAISAGVPRATMWPPCTPAR